VRRPHGLDLTTPSGRLVKRLTRPASRQLDLDASFSPDGKKVVFVRVLDKGLIDDGTKLMTVDVRSGRTRVIHRPPERPGYDEWATWSPDGRHIAFRSRYEVPGTGGLERSLIETVRPDGSRLTKIGLAEPHEAEVAPDRLLDWSANGRCLAWYTYVSQYDQDGIVLVDPRGAAPHLGGPFYPRGYQGGWPTFATFAHDGASLLVADLKDEPGDHFVIRSLSLTAPGQRVLVDDAGGAIAPVSSPDGRLFAYTDQRGRTLIRRISGGRPRVLFRKGLSLVEDWGPR
jgi:Tol biopolymer transport system component